MDTEKYLLQDSKGRCFNNELNDYTYKDNATKYNSYADASKKRKKLYSKGHGTLYIITINSEK